jgi:hypothetical protein
MPDAYNPRKVPSWLDRTPHGLIVPLVLVVSAGLAVTSLLGDSFTFDETGHLTAGFSHLYLGDFRLQPEHPPLAKMWAALPLLGMDHNWPPADTPGWHEASSWQVARTWLFERADGERLLLPARGMMVVLLLATILLIYVTARRLFGRDAGLLALVLAGLSPSLLAHGRLVTTDLPATLVVTLALLSVARLLERFTWPRFALAAGGVAVLPLAKMSALLVLPALLVMGGVALRRNGPPRATLGPASEGRHADGRVAVGRHMSPARRGLSLGVLALALTLVGWASIWTCYRWRYSAFTGPDRDTAVFYTFQEGSPGTRAEAWDATLSPQGDHLLPNLLLLAVRYARDHRLLPEAYLYGFAHMLKMTGYPAPGYLNGEIYSGGRPEYFPIAFLIKTPIATLGLLLAGIAAIALRRVPRGRDPALLAGLLAFAAIYGFFAVTSSYNFGHRHILPLYPLVFVVGGAAAGWLATRVGKVAVVAAVAWLAVANVRIYPHYLCYFNELVGGPARGHLYLADSNIDWGQDLKRLARYAAEHPDERIKLAYFGSADPTRYGFACEPLPSFHFFGEPGELTPGTYVASVNQLIGLRTLEARAEIWQNENVQAYYRQLYERYAQPTSEHASSAPSPEREIELDHWQVMRHGLLLYRLRQRAPDDRLGYSLFVYRLTQHEIDELLKP